MAFSLLYILLRCFISSLPNRDPLYEYYRTPLSAEGNWTYHLCKTNRLPVGCTTASTIIPKRDKQLEMIKEDIIESWIKYCIDPYISLCRQW